MKLIKKFSMFNYVIDNHKCSTILLENSTVLNKYFEDELNKLIGLFKEKHLKAAWVDVSAANSHLIPTLIKYNFRYHHVSSDENVVMITKFESNAEIPLYANHIISGSCIIINKNNEILLIKKNNDNENIWKMPGGRINKGEFILDNITRELKEETGVAADNLEFLGISNFGEIYPYLYGVSDLYYIGVFYDNNISPINYNTEEIANCKWIKISDYKQFNYNTPVSLKIIKVCDYFLTFGKEELSKKLFKPEFYNFQNKQNCLWSII